MSGSFLSWRISDGASPFLDKSEQPYWSTHVETWYRGHQEAEEYCRRSKLSIAAFKQWARHLVNPEDLHKRVEHLQKLRWSELERQAKKKQPKRRRWRTRYRYIVRTDSGPIAPLRAFWSMHVEALNWSGMGLAEYAAALGLSPNALRIWRDRLEDSGDEMDWRYLLHPSARAQFASTNCCHGPGKPQILSTPDISAGSGRFLPRAQFSFFRPGLHIGRNA